MKGVGVLWVVFSLAVSAASAQLPGWEFRITTDEETYESDDTVQGTTVEWDTGAPGLADCSVLATGDDAEDATCSGEVVLTHVRKETASWVWVGRQGEPDKPEKEHVHYNLTAMVQEWIDYDLDAVVDNIPAQETATEKTSAELKQHLDVDGSSMDWPLSVAAPEWVFMAPPPHWGWRMEKHAAAGQMGAKAKVYLNISDNGAGPGKQITYTITHTVKATRTQDLDPWGAWAYAGIQRTGSVFSHMIANYRVEQQ